MERFFFFDKIISQSDVNVFKKKKKISLKIQILSIWSETGKTHCTIVINVLRKSFFFGYEFTGIDRKPD